MHGFLSSWLACLPMLQHAACPLPSPSCEPSAVRRCLPGASKSPPARCARPAPCADHFMLLNLCISAQRNLAPTHPLYPLIDRPCYLDAGITAAGIKVRSCSCQQHLSICLWACVFESSEGMLSLAVHSCQCRASARLSSAAQHNACAAAWAQACLLRSLVRPAAPMPPHHHITPLSPHAEPAPRGRPA